MQKKIKNIYLRKGDHQFILLSLFIYKAKKQHWNSEEINFVVRKTFYINKFTVYKMLMNYIEK